MTTRTELSLRRRIRELEAQVASLEERLEFFEGTPSLRAGMQGETLIAQIVQGRLTAHTAPNDVILINDQEVEVKFSRLHRPMLTSACRRWDWAHPLGRDRGKRFDRLFLIGLADPRYRTTYKDPKAPYVIFDISYEEAVDMAGDRNFIGITTDPNRKASGTRLRLFHLFQITRHELEERYVFNLPNVAS